MTLEEWAAEPEPQTVTDVIARMHSLLTVLPEQDGLADFTRMYLDVTTGVQEAAGSSMFRNPVYLERLDVVFANLFFSAAVASVNSPDTVPRSWKPLFENRERQDVAPLQFALSGMNAHINRDLPVALVTTFRELGVDYEDNGPEHEDFQAVNQLLRQVEDSVKQRLVTGLLGLLDRALHDLDDRIAMWKIEKARNAAWAHGHALWDLRDTGGVAGNFLDALDGLVGFAGRGVLLRLPL